MTAIICLNESFYQHASTLDCIVIIKTWRNNVALQQIALSMRRHICDEPLDPRAGAQPVFHSMQRWEDTFSLAPQELHQTMG